MYQNQRRRLLRSRLAEFRDEKAQVQAELLELERRRESLADRLKEISTQEFVFLQALAIEEKDLRGKSPLSTSWSGITLQDAIARIRETDPDVTKEQIQETLTRVGFDFGGRAPGRAIHMVLANQQRDIRIKTKGGGVPVVTPPPAVVKT